MRSDSCVATVRFMAAVLLLTSVPTCSTMRSRTKPAGRLTMPEHDSRNDSNNFWIQNHHSHINKWRAKQLHSLSLLAVNYSFTLKAFTHTVSFIIKNLIDLDLSDEIDTGRWKRTRLSDLSPRSTPLYPIIPQSLQLAIWNWLLECIHNMHHECGLKNLQWSQVFLTCVWAELDLSMNAESFARIDWNDQIFDYECNHCNCIYNNSKETTIFNF